MTCLQKCKGCARLDYCKTRAEEWIRNIDVILNGYPRPKGEGQAMAEEIINYMQKDFLGGIKT